MSKDERAEIVETMARAMCAADGYDPDEQIHGGQATAFQDYGPRWQADRRSDNTLGLTDYVTLAEAAIAAYERAREQGGVSEPSAPSEWQKRGPDFNEWEIEWERFATMLADAKGEYFWIYDGALKYLNIRLDTRSNAFILRDRDDNRIDPARVEAAIRQCRDMRGGVVKIDRDGRRAHQGEQP